MAIVDNISRMILDLFTNRILLSCLFAYLIAQVLKAFYFAGKKRKFSLWWSIEYGGMPSSHAATVAALVYSVFMYEGIGTLFAVSLVFSVFIIRDALGLRRLLGRHAEELNRIYNKKLLKEDVGHTVAQTIAGLVIGVMVSAVVFVV